MVEETDDRRPSLRDSIGLVRLHILALGTATIMAASTVLGFIWRGSATVIGGGDPGQLWRDVVTNGWAPVAVTICSAAIRTAMSLQAGVIMSMVASVLLQKHRVKLGDSAFLSIIRAVGVQPVGFLFTGGRGLVKSLGFVGFPLLIITSLVSVASAFTSSILLWDFGDIRITGSFNVSYVGFARPSAITGTDIWRSPPSEFPRFAEYANTSDRITNHPHVDDTGLTFRVPIPMTVKNSRETLREYHGPATVFDRRVVCIAPKEFRILRIMLSEGGLSYGGNATFDTDLPLPLRGAEPDKQVPFQCMVPDMVPGSGVNITLCVVAPPGGPDPLGIEPSFPFLKSSYSTLNASIFFMLKGTASNNSDGWRDFGRRHFTGNSPSSRDGFKVPPEALVATREGPWTVTKITGVQYLEGVQVAATACVMTENGFPFNVTIRSEVDGPEPALRWNDPLNKLEFNVEEELGAVPMYNTKNILSQLNVVGLVGDQPPSLEQRGVMSLEFLKTDWSLPLHAGDSEDISDGMFGLNSRVLFPWLQVWGKVPGQEVRQTADASATMKYPNSNGISNSTGAGHPVQIALFLDALAAAGGKPALALQSWMTTLTWQRYYDSFGWFTDKALGRYAQSVEVFAPTKWNGFIAAMVIVGYHVLIVVALTSWFLVVNRHTMLGNSWLAVSQVVSEATSSLIERSGNLNDSQVEKMIRQEMAGEGTGHKFGIVRNRKTGRVEVAREIDRQKKKLLA
ncbi:hypothetical protein V8F33_009873 [Rhypophila sp. PSN 637]